MEGRTSAAQTVRLLRHQRHDFLNHLQVISGWLQLNRPERAQQYIEAAVSQLTAEAELMRKLPPDVSVAALELSTEARRHAARLVWRVSDASHSIDVDQLRERVLGVLKAGIAADGHQERRLIVTLGPESEIAVHTPLDPSEG